MLRYLTLAASQGHAAEEYETSAQIARVCFLQIGAAVVAAAAAAAAAASLVGHYLGSLNSAPATSSPPYFCDGSLAVLLKGVIYFH